MIISPQHVELHYILICDFFCIGEYSDLYLKTDVLLLASVFEKFRQSCMANYGLDPAHYYTTPGFSWDAMLKYTKVEIELLTDIDMLLFLERGVRGGISQCSLRYAKADNEYTQTRDEGNISDKTYLLYFDVNALYAYAMSLKLPLRHFKWCPLRDFNEMNRLSEQYSVGFILEVDLEYDRALHDLHKDYPLCSENKCPPGGKHSKLLLTLDNKKNYIIHHVMLKFVLSQGLKLKAIHNVLQFDERPWLKPYIELNTEMRTRATNDFEKNLYKLLSNSVFGKCMENVRKRVDIKLRNHWNGRYGAGNLVANPNFKRATIFDENLVAIEMYKTEIKMFKPVAVGMAVLDLSKVVMCDFHYNKMLPFFNNRSDNCTVAYTDTDSYIYRIRLPYNQNIYRELILKNLNWFDTNDYPKDNQFGIPQVNKKVPGLMKDECNGQIMTEFVGLRSKMYSVKIAGQDAIRKAKGVKRNVVDRKLKFKDYFNCLLKEDILVGHQKNIRSKLHEINTIDQKKIMLSPFDDKRFIKPNNIDTLPWGHYSINQ